MRAIQGKIERIQDKFAHQERGERKIVLARIALIFNLRSRRNGIIQIESTYIPNLIVETSYFLFLCIKILISLS